MGSSWGVFAVPASEIGALAKACTTLDFDAATLFVGPTLSPVAGAEPWVAFGFEHGTSYIEGAMSDDVPNAFYAAFTRVVTLDGGGNHDSVMVTQYVRGVPRLQRDTTFGYSLYPLVKVVGFDLLGLSSWAGFGINPVELSGREFDVNQPMVPLNPTDFTAEPLAPELHIPESLDALEQALKDGGAEAIARLALAGLYRGDTRRADMYDAADEYRNLEDGSALKKAVAAVMDMAGR